jgi:chromosome segregation ATPase
MREWYAANKTKKLAYQREYAANPDNRERIRARTRERASKMQQWFKRWTTLGSDQQACDNWTSDPDGHKESLADPLAAIQAQIDDVQGKLLDLRADVDEIRGMVNRTVAAVIAAQTDVD